MEIPSKPSPKKRKAPGMQDSGPSLGYKTGELRAAAHAHFEAVKHLFEGRPIPLSFNSDNVTPPPSTPPPATPPPAFEGQTDYWQLIDQQTDDNYSIPFEHQNTPFSPPKATKLASQQVDVLPAKSAANLEQRFARAFETLLPKLEEPYLRYVSSIQDGIVPESIPHQEECPCQCIERIIHQRTVKCYMFKGMPIFF